MPSASPSEFRRAIASRSPAPVYLLLGDDDVELMRLANEMSSLVEEELRIRPTHGFIVCGDGTRHRIENTTELRAWVLELAGQIRAAVMVPIQVNPVRGQCRPCGMRGHCGQARI